MNKKLFSILVLGMLVALGCSTVNRIGIGRRITPSKVIISEDRDVSGFSGIVMSTLGKVVLSQGNSESLTVSGSDNLVPLIKTTVRDGTLYIETSESINITGFTSEDMLTYTLVVKDLNSLTLGGLGEMEMGTLRTPKLSVIMSGSGMAKISQLTTDELTVDVSGLGSVDLAGEAKQANIKIPGAGSVNAPDLKIQTANVTIPGLGSATLWVTDRLSGNISGAGSLSYYGTPQTDFSKTGLGDFKALGEK